MLSYDPYAALAELKPFAPLTLTSPGFENGGALPLSAWAAGRGGEDLSPELTWSAGPEGTASYALSVFDPDAPTGSGWWHWAVYNIPANVTSLNAGAGSLGSSLLPTGAITLANEARNEKYDGAAPPNGTGVHRYFFVVDALDVPALDIPAGATPAMLGFNRHFHSLARGVLVGTATPSS